MPRLLSEVKGRFTIPSGIVATTTDTIARLAEEIPEIGIQTTKSIGLQRREGNKESILARFDGNGTFINAVGLANPGAEEFAKELKEIYPLPKNKFLLTSIFGSTAKEFQEVAKIVAPYSDGLELNCSCPHAEPGYGATIGSSPELTKKFTMAVKEVVDIPVFVKLTPNVEDIGIIARAAIEGGADGITAINTVGPYESSILSHGKGGISGFGVKEKGIQCIKRISEVIREMNMKREIPIIAMGGIRTAQDVLDYCNAGAKFFGVGSALAGMDTESIKKYFYNLEREFCLLKKGHKIRERKVDLTVMELMKYRYYMITKIKQVSDDLNIFYFNKGIKANPGQFVFVKLPAHNAHEKPFSIADDDPLTIAVRRIGDFTSKLFELKKKDVVCIRGPYGKGFDIAEETESMFLVGGGTGLAPLHFLAKTARKKHPLTICMGAKTKDQLLFLKEFKKYGEAMVATEDGSEGKQGLVTANLKEHLENEKRFFTNSKISFYNCGPELMIKEVMRIEKKSGYAKQIQALIERYMKCGIGICGSSAMDGKRVCVDGPVFTGKDLLSSKHFGKLRRDASGTLINFKLKKEIR